jgi:hypothetical protein
MAAPLTTQVRDALTRATRDGWPAAVIAVIAILAVVALLISAAGHTNAKASAYAEMTVRRGSCLLDETRSYNVDACYALGPRSFGLSSHTSLRSTTAVVSTGSCCAASVGASVTGDRTVTVAFVRLRGVVRVSVVVP